VRKAVNEQYDPASGKIPVFHLTTDPIIPNFNLQSSAEDNDFGVKLRNTLHVERNVEYCQWSEHYTEHCERCRKFAFMYNFDIDNEDTNIPESLKYERSCCPINEAHRPLADTKIATALERTTTPKTGTATISTPSCSISLAHITIPSATPSRLPTSIRKMPKSGARESTCRSSTTSTAACAARRTTSTGTPLT
jgi:hypothetical protein